MKVKESDSIPEDKPAQIIEYSDPLEGFKGWLVRDRMCHRLCAGGMRVQSGLTCEKLIDMARNMTRKMQIANLRVDGAKSGIDYDPESPGKNAAVSRFLQAIKPHIESSYSMGPDLNIEMDELEKIAQQSGIPSVKMAIAKAQGWELEYYTARKRILKDRIGGWSVGRLRAGYGVAAATLATLDFLNISPQNGTVTIQGFGTLAKATAFRLHKAGVKIIAIADVEKCLVAADNSGLEVERLLTLPGPLLDADASENYTVKPSEAILDQQCDILIPAAVEKSVQADNAASMQVKAVVPGANLAVTGESEQILHNRSILVLPDFLAGCGGSLSMEGLFGPPEHPDAQSVLSHIENKMMEIVYKVLQRSEKESISPTGSALRFCDEFVCMPDTRPYGTP
jgi:glutamate dehydrogenase (NAD(P)+)